MLNFVLIHRTVIAYNFLQQQAKLWNIPLAVAQLIKMLSLGVMGIRPELHVERPARGDDPQFFVKNDQRFSNVSTIAWASAQASSTSLNCSLNTGDLSLSARDSKITQPFST